MCVSRQCPVSLRKPSAYSCEGSAHLACEQMHGVLVCSVCASCCICIVLLLSICTLRAPLSRLVSFRYHLARPRVPYGCMLCADRAPGVCLPVCIECVPFASRVCLSRRWCLPCRPVPPLCFLHISRACLVCGLPAPRMVCALSSRVVSVQNAVRESSRSF